MKHFENFNRSVFSAYEFTRLFELLRIVRNTKHHFIETEPERSPLSPYLKGLLGPLQSDILR